LKYEFEQLKL